MAITGKWQLWAGAIIYVFILFMFLTYFRFPVHKLAVKKIDEYTGGRIQAEIEKSTPIPLFGYRLENIVYTVLLQGREIQDRIISLDLRPVLKNVFIGYIPIRLDIFLERGRLDGKIRIPFAKKERNNNLSLHVQGIHLEDSAIISSSMNRALSGELNGSLQVETSMADISRAQGKGWFSIEKGDFEIKLNIPGLNSVSFDMAQASFDIDNGILKLEKGKIEGPMLHGPVSGEIRLNKKAANSRLDIKAEMEIGSGFTNNNILNKLISRFGNKNGPYIFKISGTFGHPSVNWVKK